MQLQRLTYEEAGQGEWCGGVGAVPLTREGDVIGVPEGVDVRHPRLGNDCDGNKSSGEAARLMVVDGVKGM